jgi:hypothetical protein
MIPSSVSIAPAKTWRNSFLPPLSPSRAGSMTGQDHGVVKAGYPATIQSVVVKTKQKKGEKDHATR